MEQQYYNLVFVNHDSMDSSERNYLFKLPLNIKLNAKTMVYVRTSKGDSLGICVSNSFIVGQYEANCISDSVGAYYPIKDVIGLAQKQDGYKCVEFDLMDLPF